MILSRSVRAGFSICILSKFRISCEDMVKSKDSFGQKSLTAFNHGKTKSVRNQKRNAIFRRKNEMCNKKASKQ